MLRYTVNRVLLMIPTLIGVAVLVFLHAARHSGRRREVKLRGDGGNVSQKPSRGAPRSVSTSR
jgi:peptide/nickel transport system permease protein